MFLLGSVFLYGAGLQVVAPQADLKEFKNAKNLVFVEENPAQFTINIPLDLDSAVGRQSRDGTKTGLGNFTLICVIWHDGDFDNTSYKQKREIQPGSYTTTCKFNGIPEDIALKINRYTVRVTTKVKEDGGNYYLFIFDSTEETNSNQTAIIID